MKAWIWLRALAIILALFAGGHTLGTAIPRVTRGPQEAAVFDAMQSFRFPVMGFDRTHWDFYRGFALIISAQLLVMVALAWQLSALSRRSPQGALPMAITLQLGCVSLLILSYFFFFGGPIVMSLLAVACASVAVALLVKELPHESPAP
ncbi:MAG: hypothetical protein NVS1B4_20440 [Gemmatimonadaceae bacterium]